MKLVIGNKNYSSWSLRPWLLLKHFKLNFEEVQESLKAEGLSERLRKHSPSAKVPVLIDKTLHVWDSLAICEYINEQYLQGRAWPSDTHTRAHARSVSAEMHSSFTALRNEMPMNCRAKRSVDASSGALNDIAYIDTLWSQCLTQYGGPWLFGEFSIADCFYAPVVLRMKTYGVELSPLAQTYVDHLSSADATKFWISDALKETEIIPEDEAGSER